MKKSLSKLELLQQFNSIMPIVLQSMTNNVKFTFSVCDTTFQLVSNPCYRHMNNMKQKQFHTKIGNLIPPLISNIGVEVKLKSKEGCFPFHVD
jgi:hypothetical protein